jgi:hypothetical protein
MAKVPKQYGAGLALAPRAPTKQPDAPEADAVSVAPAPPLPSPPSPEPASVAEYGEDGEDEARPVRRRPMESKADPTMLYLHPEGKGNLKRFALGRGMKVRVHDLLMEAVEEWAERRGVKGPFRVPSLKPRRKE